MHIHVSKKMLESTRFSVEKVGKSLNIKGYNVEQVEGETCDKCALETFESNKTIYIKNISANKRCQCNPGIDPLISFKVDTETTDEIKLI